MIILATADGRIARGEPSAQTDLPALVAALSESDLEVLRNALSEPRVALVTSVGTAKFDLWTEFADRGWMQMGPLPPGGPVGQEMWIFTLTELGLRKIPALLDPSLEPDSEAP